MSDMTSVAGAEAAVAHWDAPIQRVVGAHAPLSPPAGSGVSSSAYSVDLEGASTHVDEENDAAAPFPIFQNLRRPAESRKSRRNNNSKRSRRRRDAGTIAAGGAGTATGSMAAAVAATATLATRDYSLDIMLDVDPQGAVLQEGDADIIKSLTQCVGVLKRRHQPLVENWLDVLRSVSFADPFDYHRMIHGEEWMPLQAATYNNNMKKRTGGAGIRGNSKQVVIIDNAERNRLQQRTIRDEYTRQELLRAVVALNARLTHVIAQCAKLGIKAERSEPL